MLFADKVTVFPHFNKIILIITYKIILIRSYKWRMVYYIYPKLFNT